MVVGVLHAHRDARRVVIAQVLADAGQRVAHVDAERLQMRGRADAGHLQQLRRIERAARQDHLAARAHLDRRAIASALAVAHADRALALEDQARSRARCVRTVEVRPLHRGMQERARRAHAPAFVDRALRVVDAELARAVVVGIARNAEALGARDEGLAQRMVLVDVGDRHRAFAPAEGLVALADAALDAA